MERMTLLAPTPVVRSRDPRALWRAWMRGELGFTRTMALVSAVLMVAFAGDMLRYTIGWFGYAAVVALLLVLLGVAFARRVSPLRARHLPTMLLAFLGWCALSIAWSQYRLETAGAVVVLLATAFAGMSIAVSLTRFQFVRAAGAAFRGLVYGRCSSAGVALWWPGGVVPPAYLYSGDLQRMLGPDAPSSAAEMPAHFYWSHGDLFTGGALQGLPGNRNLLAMVALLALIITLAELWDRQLGWTASIIGAVAAVFTLWRSDSVTVYVAIAFVLLGAALVAAGRRLRRPGRWLMYVVVGALLIAGAVFVVLNNNEIFAQMNRTSDMSGRGDIWRSVLALGATSPLVGIGWIGYWVPWLPQFAQLGVVNGTAYHQAHNAFLEVWLQTGAVGLAFFAVLVFTTLIRTWWVAIDRPDTPLVEPIREDGTPHLAGSTALPFLIMVALVVQAMTESRLIIEGGWLLLTSFAIYAKLRVQDPVILPRGIRPSTRTGPIAVVVDRLRDV